MTETLPDGTKVLGHAWCPECRRRQPIVDKFVNDTGDSRARVEVDYVSVMACDHDVTVTRDGGASPLQQAKLPRAYALAAQDPWEDE